MNSLLFLFYIVSFLNGAQENTGLSETDSQGAIVRLHTDRKVIHLIFSADIAFEGAESILETLDANSAKASFFLTGNCLREKKFESIVRKIIQQEHYLGGHSDNHLLYASWNDRQESLVSADSLIADFRKNMAELRKFGVDVSRLTYFLPPYEYYNKEHVRLIEADGQNVINYTPGIRTAADYTTPDMPNYLSSGQLIEQLFAFEAEHGLNGCIILIHPGTHESRTDKLYSHLDEIIRRLKLQGYFFERLP
ncbi:MAG: polysaccharide deacetylase family protein [Candidatus Symbiothrix sp.]|jgi:peptidoglycan/xylan/chitin deacetylase (PgdA/CDA1 family)|nr:polysaccharide deacetylase family protein [Candidatus Symbiothrix sp.]